MNNKNTNIIICGLGGQGVLYISNILSQILVSNNFDVKVSQIYGMAKRGGQVYTEIRFGENIFSPVIEDNTLDFLLDLDGYEFINYMNKLNSSSTIIVPKKSNFYDLYNQSVIIIDMKKYVKKHNIDYSSINVFLLGILIKNIKSNTINYKIDTSLYKFHDKSNYEAFKLGLSL